GHDGPMHRLANPPHPQGYREFASLLLRQARALRPARAPAVACTPTPAPSLREAYLHAPLVDRRAPCVLHAHPHSRARPRPPRHSAKRISTLPSWIGVCPKFVGRSRLHMSVGTRRDTISAGVRVSSSWTSVTPSRERASLVSNRSTTFSAVPGPSVTSPAASGCVYQTIGRTPPAYTPAPP